MPGVWTWARENRHYLVRAVRYLVRECGITQFLDIGSGLPTSCNVHQVAAAEDPTSRVVYVDKSPVVGAHLRALRAEAGQTEFILADATEPEAILSSDVLARALDLQRPVALMMISVLMYFDDVVVRSILDTLLGALPPGSYLAISHPTGDFDPATRDAAETATGLGLTYLLRSEAEVAAMFAGLDLVDPGVVPMLTWRPERRLRELDARGVSYWVGVARTPGRSQR